MEKVDIHHIFYIMKVEIDSDSHLQYWFDAYPDIGRIYDKLDVNDSFNNSIELARENLDLAKLYEEYSGIKENPEYDEYYLDIIYGEILSILEVYFRNFI